MKENINQLRKIKTAWQESNKKKEKKLAMEKETEMKEMKEDRENEKRKTVCLKLSRLENYMQLKDKS